MFALSLFNEARVQVREARRALCKTGCSTVRATVAGALLSTQHYLLIVQLGPVSRLNHTTGHGEPHGVHNQALAYHL